MKHLLLAACAALLFHDVSYAKDMGYRYRDGKCVNGRGEEGLNPSFIGQCADLRNVILARMDLDEVDFSGARFTNSDLQQSTFRKSVLIGTDFEGANLAGVEFSETKIQAANFRKINLKNVKIIDSDFRAVDFSGGDLSATVLSYVKFYECEFSNTNFSRATLDYTEFDGSRFDGADFGGANLRNANLSLTHGNGVNFTAAELQKANLEKAAFPRADFRRAKLEDAHLKGADLTKANLRAASLKGAQTDGATMTEAIYTKRTVLPFSNDVARSRGMVEKKDMRLLIIWDEKSAALESFVTAMQAAEVEVSLSVDPETKFIDVAKLQDVDAVLHLNSTTYDVDMPAIGQKGLVEFVKNGGIYMDMEWSSYEIGNGRMNHLRDLILFDYNGTGQTTFNLVPMPTEAKHPVLQGITENIAITVGGWTSLVHQFGDNPVRVLMQSSTSNTPMVVAREFGAGKVVGFGFTATYSGVSSLTNPGFQKLVVNAINWQ